ncbi:hypothetical protein SDC9_128131 [bioreactor metagenome]|uniref:Uncharacterized protein n=1 Tax=bioreactor metagenome TaxID=1076179 RepID=A0A645CVZ6_9ZZZZ
MIYCVIQNGTPEMFNGKGNVFTDPQLQVLANNGGLTPTIAIGKTGSAYRTGTAANIIMRKNIVPNTDQIGNKRHSTPCIGAYELID